MQDPSAPDPRHEYMRRWEARRAARDIQNKRHVTLGNVRLLVGLVAVAMGIAAFGAGVFSGWWLLGPAGVLWWLGGRLQRVEATRHALSRAVAFYARGLLRLHGDWADTAEPGTRFLDEHHLYAYDLDIFGRASLFELLTTARTRMGEETLAAWLMAPAPPHVVRDRQEAVVELAPRLDLREDLAVIGERFGAGVHPDALAAWGERASILGSTPGQRVAAGFSSFRVVAWALSVVGALTILSLFAPLLVSPERLARLPLSILVGLRVCFPLFAVAVILILWRFRKRTNQIIHKAEQATEDLDLLAGVLQRLEAERFTSRLLASLRAELDIDGKRPSQRLAQLHRIMDVVDSRHNMIVMVLGPFLLLDLHLAYALEDWRRTSGPAMRRWLTAVGEIEALSSLAAYRYEHPRDVFPEFVTETACFEGTALAHPLLPEHLAVPNDVTIGPGAPQVLVVSGSNMSGKSTLLRTVGVNAVLAQAGGPVRARRLRLSPLALGASIHVQDSLKEGKSRFYAEITRLRHIMDKAENASPVLFLLDEFLQGTNSHDRRIGAEAIVRGLVDRQAIGLVTTHDLALAHIADGLGARAANVHFEDYLQDGHMRFDYRLRPGVVQKSNAIALMRSVGLDV